MGDGSLHGGVEKIRQNKAELIVGLYTSWDDYDPNKIEYKSVKDHLAQYIQQLTQVQYIQNKLLFPITHINVHSGMD